MSLLTPLLTRAAYGLLRRHLARGTTKKPLRAYLARKGFTVDVPVDGLWLRCHFDDNRTEQLLAEGRNTERDNLRLIAAYLPAGGTFVDIGANCGLYTVFGARAAGPKGRVLAIEPLPQMAERTALNVALNGLDNVTLVHGAVGPEEGTLTFHALPHQLGQSSMIEVPGSVPLKVQVRPLLALVKEAGIQRIDVLKIDVEGYEDQALLPFFTHAPKSLWPAHLFMETERSGQWREDCTARLLALGYRVAWSSKNDMLLALA